MTTYTLLVDGVATVPAQRRPVSLARAYIGITGIVTDADVDTARACARLVPPSHRLMAGVLVSAKTLRGQSTTSRRYPAFDRVETLLRELLLAGCWPVVHYNTRATDANFAAELGLLVDTLPSMRGLQLNVVAPCPDVVSRFAAAHRSVEVVLQVNRAAMLSLPTTQTGDAYDRHVACCAVADEVSEYVARYGRIAHVLLDASGGEGRALNTSLAGTIIGRNGDEWRDRGCHAGIAGGFGPDSNDTLASVAVALKVAAANRAMCSDGADRFEVALADLSFDAESGVRSPVADPAPGEKHQDALDADKARAWVSLVASAVGDARSLRRFERGAEVQS